MVHYAFVKLEQGMLFGKRSSVFTLAPQVYIHNILNQQHSICKTRREISILWAYVCDSFSLYFGATHFHD